MNKIALHIEKKLAEKSLRRATINVLSLEYLPFS